MAHLLEDQIEQLSWQVPCRWSQSHGWLGSYQCSHSQWSHSAGCHEQDPSVASCDGNWVKWHAQSPSLIWPQWWFTFKDLKLEIDTAAWELPTPTQSSKDASDWSQLEEGDTSPPPSLKADLEHFLGGDMPSLRAKGERVAAGLSSQTLPWGQCQMGRMEGWPEQYSSAVAGIIHHSQWVGYKRVSPKD